jgi:hypothetical protein
MLFIFFSFIGIVLVIAIIMWPLAGLFMILRGKKEFSCLSCGILSQRYPPLSMGAGFRLRCSYCGQKTLIPSNSPAAQQGMGKILIPPVTPMPICIRCGFRSVEGARFCCSCGAVVSAVAPISSQPERNTVSARTVILVALFILGITGAIWALIVAEAGTPTSTPAGTTAKPAQPTPDNTLQTPQATDNEATQTLEEAEKDKQLKLGTDAMVTAWQWTPVAFNERENLRFDAVIVMPDDTVCLSIHDAHPFPGVEEPNALISLQDKGVPPGRRLYPVNNVSFDLWTRECVNQPGGIDVEPEILERFNLIKQHMEELNQRLHNSQQ